MLTIFDPTDTLLKLTVDKSFILRPGMMYLKVRSCIHWRGGKAKAVLKSYRKHLSLKPHIETSKLEPFANHLYHKKSY